MPVFTRQPHLPLVLMPFLCPIPQVAVDLVVHFAEGLACDYVPMIVGPSPNHRVKGPDHIAGFHGRKLPDCFLDLIQERFDIVHGRSYEQLAPVLARVLPKEIKSVLYPGNPGFLRG